MSQEGIPLLLRFNALGPIAQISFRSLRRILDRQIPSKPRPVGGELHNSKVRFNANPKLDLGTQTLGLPPFRLTENGYQNSFKNLNGAVSDEDSARFLRES